MDLNFTDGEPVCCYEKYLLEMIKRSEQAEDLQAEERLRWSTSLKDVLLRHRQKKAARFAQLRQQQPLRPPRTYLKLRQQQTLHWLLVAVLVISALIAFFYYF